MMWITIVFSRNPPIKLSFGPDPGLSQGGCPSSGAHLLTMDDSLALKCLRTRWADRAVAKGLELGQNLRYYSHVA